MEYVKGQPYFCSTPNKIKQYPYLNKDIECDILIVGGGIDGAILNYFLSSDYNVTLVDMSRFGCCCTSCATVLLEYQLDDYAKDLLKYMNGQDIVSAYKMGLKSIDMIDDFIKQKGNLCHFRKVPSFMYTNSIFGVKAMEDEHKFRIQYGFKSQFFTRENNPFPFEIKAGIYNEDGGAEFNPYLFAKQMIENASNQNNLYENTKIINFIEKENYIEANTNFGNKIICKKIVLATGFNFSLMRDKNLCERVISYTIVTKPIKNIKWKRNALVQDDEEPYHYLRILPDKRLIFGGEDTKFKLKPIKDSLAEKKYKKLLQKLKNMLPEFSDQIEIDYKFCGAFGSTDNNLGLIGQTENDNVYYFLSAGANGIINAIFGWQIIKDQLAGEINPLAHLFSPLR